MLQTSVAGRSVLVGLAALRAGLAGGAVGLAPWLYREHGGPGVWLFFGLGRSFAKELQSAELPGVAGKLLPTARLDELRSALEARGMRVVFLGRLAVFPSSLMAAADGSAGVPWRDFVLADSAGALVSLAMALGLGYVLGETYEEAGPWLTAVGADALLALAVIVGRALVSRSGPRS